MIIPLEWFCVNSLIVGCFPQSELSHMVIFYLALDRFHDWEDSVFGLKHECVRFIFIPSQMKFFLWLLNWLFKIYSKATLSHTVFLRIMLLSVLCVMRRKEGGRRGPELLLIYTQIFYTFPPLKVLQDSAWPWLKYM